MSCYSDFIIYTTTHNICVKRLVKHFKLLSATKDNSPIELIYFEKDNISTQEKETNKPQYGTSLNMKIIIYSYMYRFLKCN